MVLVNWLLSVILLLCINYYYVLIIVITLITQISCRQGGGVKKEMNC